MGEGQHILQIFVDPETVCFCSLHQAVHDGTGFRSADGIHVDPVLSPRVKGRMARSAVLLSMGTFLSVRKNRRYSSWFRLYWRALQVLLPAGTFGRDVSGPYLWFYRKARPGGTTRRSASHPVRQRSLRVPEYR